MNHEQTVALYGGSFNPIHNGHTQLAMELLRRHMADELWFMVSPQNPFKVNASMLDDDVRLRLAQLAVKDMAESDAGTMGGHLHVSDFEMHMPRPSYMVHTLEALRNAHPDTHFTLVIGADNWLEFDRWKSPDEILRHHSVIVFPRPGYTVDTTTLPRNVQFLDTPLFNISSTSIRESIREGHFHGDGLSKSVWREIREKGYYKD